MTSPELINTNNPDVRPARVTLLGFSIEKKALRAVLTAFISTRLMVFLIIFISSATMPMLPGQYLYADPDNLVLDGLIRHDSWWYVNIATRGYNMGNLETGEQGNVAFFPLYPLLARMTAALTGNVYLAGVLVANIAFLVALSYLYALTRREFDDPTAARAVFYFAGAPTAVFFSAMYTESVFVLLVIMTFYYARERQWVGAALAGALCAATRNTGVLLAAVIALEGMHQHGVRFLPTSWNAVHLRDHVRTLFKGVLPSWRSLLAAAFVPMGLFAYMAYLAIKFGDPIAFITVQATWGRETNPAGITRVIGTTLEELNIGSRFLAGQVNMKTLLDVLFTLGFAPLILAVAFKMRPAHAVFVGLTFLVPLSTGSTGSMTRYILMLIPCFMLLAHWGWRSWVDRAILAIFLPLMAYFTVLFSHWYFAG